MNRFILLVLLVIMVYILNSLSKDPLQQYVPSTVRDSIRATVDSVKGNPDVNLAMDALNQQLNSLLTRPDDRPREAKDTNVETPKLTVPQNQLFSIHNIELGESRAEVEQETGRPKRSSINEYGVNWEAYHEDYQNFIMVAYENDIVRGIYTNQDLIASSTGIKLGSPKESVREYLGTPESIIRKGLVNYKVNSDGGYDIFHLDHNYATVFYDKHRNNTVTAILIIDETLEQNKNTLYTESSEQLKEGFEYQLFDLTNASRENHDLPLLTWDDHVRETAREHSLDMAENQYFDHTNRQGQSPFDRMEEDNIRFITAGENLAYGQFSSIFAHAGLMNSLGHRKNILEESYQYLGVGVAFNDEAQPYYTENFYSDSPSL